MHIGLDFDNTIVSYDTLFHRVAVEKSLIPADFTVDKLVIRDYLRKLDQEEKWTALQGEVYGARMQEAEVYPGFLGFLKKLRSKGHRFTIVSHKTKHPYLGPTYDLHAIAAKWINHHLVQDDGPLFSKDSIFFEITKEEKLARIQEINCDIFIDDLPEILLAKQFPLTTKRFLFDPTKHHVNHTFLNNDHDIHIFASWPDCEAGLAC